MSTVQTSNKRKRTDTAGGSVVSTPPPSASQPVPGPSKGQALVNSSSFEAPAAWTFFLQNVPATNIPPPGVLAAFAKMYHSAIAGYRSSLKQHHKITTAWNRFAVESEGDSVPPAIANTLKGPTFLFPKDLSTSGEERTAEARETYTSALKMMKKAAVDYVRACHKHNVEASQALIDAESKGMCLSVDLQSYASQVIKDAGHTDSNLWNAYINAVVSALGAELSSIRFDVAALVLAERQEKAAKQAALNTATADAEMMDSTQPIESIIKEHVESAGMLHTYPPHTSPSHVLSLPSSSLHPCSVQTTRQASGRDRQRVEKEEAKEEQTESGTSIIQRPERFGVVLESCDSVFERSSVEEKGKGACRKRKRKRKRKEKDGTYAGEEGEGKVEEVETLGVKRLRLDTSYSPPAIPHLVTTWTPPPGVKFHRLKPDTYPPIFFSAPLMLQSRFVTARMSPLFYDTRITNRTFHNMTSVKLSYEQVKMLALNSKFVPRPRKTSVKSVSLAFDDFERRLRLSEKARKSRALIVTQGLDPDLDKGQPRYVAKFHIPNSSAEAPKMLLHVEFALQQARKLLEVQVLDRQTLHVRPNISQKELNKLLQILKDERIVALPSDKNLGLCLVSADWYQENGFKLLLNPSYIEEEPDHELLSTSLETIVMKASNFLTWQQLTWLLDPIKNHVTKVPVLKVIPKIHKLPISARPIVPTFGTLLANASAWVDYRLKPLLHQFSWILPDSKTFCRQILDVKLPIGKEVWLVSGDVVAMYPNIPIEDGICKIASILGVRSMFFTTLEEAVKLEVKSLDELTILLMRMVLQFNYVAFSGKTFRQVIGTAMGTALAPDYANLFLAGYEGPALKEFHRQILYYGRFIDDTFAIIEGNLEAVLKFQKRFGELHPNMKMEWTQSRYKLPFLDVSVSLEVAPGVLYQSTKAAIVTRVFQKALNAYLYIPWKSCHSDASKKSWVKGELIRYVRLSSREEDFKEMVKMLSTRLRARGYPGRWLRSVFSGVSYATERPKALTPRTPLTEWENRDRLYVLKLTHNPLWDSVDFGPIWKTLRDAWEETGLGKPDDRFLASFKKPESLSDRLNKTNRETIEAYQAELAMTV